MPLEEHPATRALHDRPDPTVRRLVEAVCAGDITAVQLMLSARPELVHMDVHENDEHRALHHAVLRRQPEIVRVLMRYGADARKGIWPHRDATSPLTMATERGDAEIVDIIREEERRPSETATAVQDVPVAVEPVEASRRGDDAAPVRVSDIRSAIVTGDADWLKARHAEGALSDGLELITLAVESERPEILALLLDFGLDPDERERLGGLEEVVWSWGTPLRECARAGNTAMAAILLEHGANPNTNVYAASAAMHLALARHDEPMVHLLEKHGGFVDAVTAANLGLIDRVRQMFDDEKAGRLADGVLTWCESLPYAVLEAATDGGHVDLVRMALDHLDWPPGDPRWQGMLMRSLGWHDASDRERYVTCFRMIIDRSGLDIPWRFGRTTLHDVAADWPRPPMTADDRIPIAAILLEKGARLDVRDDLLKSTPLGWACRWGRIELVNLLLQAGADPIEADAEPWATPRAWAEKMHHQHVLAALRTE
jgi:hypothetical protein